LILTINNNGGRIFRIRKADILFIVGIGLLIYGAVTHDGIIALIGGGAVGIPIAQRVDKP
jgi:hypothetical protein